LRWLFDQADQNVQVIGEELDPNRDPQGIKAGCEEKSELHNWRKSPVALLIAFGSPDHRPPNGSAVHGSGFQSGIPQGIKPSSISRRINRADLAR
jgi:hypothetical protein